MTILTHADINRIADAHDSPYSWPDNTCMSPVLSVIRAVTGREPPPHPFLAKTERRAMAALKAMYAGSWGLLGIEYLQLTGLGRQISERGPFVAGDIVEFRAPFLDTCLAPNGACIGLVACDDTVLVRGVFGIFPVPLPTAHVILAGRATCRPS